MIPAAKNTRNPLPGPAAALRVAEPAAPVARLQRSVGVARIAFKPRGRLTVLDELHQSGCCKVRFPKPEPGAPPEAVLINTAGGLTDADHLTVEARWGSGALAAVTSQAAERVYRSRGAPARVVNRLYVAAGGTAFWLPQETILFDGGRLARCMTATLEEGGQLLACESIVFGRRAMGEAVRQGAIRESWQVRYAGRLVFADSMKLDADIESMLARPGVANGAAAVAGVVYAGPVADRLLDPVRETTANLASTAACSAIGPVLNLRILGESGAAVRRDLRILLAALLRGLDCGGANVDRKSRLALPRAWSC